MLSNRVSNSLLDPECPRMKAGHEEMMKQMRRNPPRAWMVFTRSLLRNVIQSITLLNRPLEVAELEGC